ncbi:uncharacterized protein LOC118770680 [Megalops cyprinoides]|uniref:uncharacterized protein LOC118770680 n=1 Tax=Megalops cyprinoides TaxID=118141 RepID=UPI0018648CCB|nr:uncharacterized protein LOC118770680 [Megalops cyprinoides]
MGKVNSCLKRVFIFFNFLFGILGGVLLVFGILAHALHHEQIENKMIGIFFLYIIGGATMAISFVGAYGAYKEKKWALIVFVTVMSLGGIALLWIAVPLVISRPTVYSVIEEQFRSVVPLDEADPQIQQAAETLQAQFKCCGLFDGYRDWRSHIPQSCLCSPDQSADKCEKAERSYRMLDFSRFSDRLRDTEKLVYKQSCFPILMTYAEKALDITLGILFGLAVLALLGALMAVIMLCQIKDQPVAAPAVFTVNPQPPKYSELFNNDNCQIGSTGSVDTTNFKMGKVNSCLKRVFIFFNFLFGILGGVLLVFGILAHALHHEQVENKMVGLIFLYIIGGATMAISFVGAYGAYKEKKWALIVFVVVMIMGGIALLRIAVPIGVARPAVYSVIEEQFRSAVPLDEADPQIQQAAETLQAQFKCCGLFDGYRDWRSHIPQSCLCSPDQSADKCEKAERSYQMLLLSHFSDRTLDTEKLVYKQSCFPILMTYAEKALDITLGILFGLAVLALLGALMAVIMLCQIKDQPVVAPAVFTVNPQPPKYSELFNKVDC